MAVIKLQRHRRGAGTIKRPYHRRGPLIFTREVFDAIPGWVEMGARPEDIAAAIGTTVGSLKVKCSHAGISLASIRPAVGGGLHPRVWAALRREADQRGMTTQRLMTEIVASVATHNLFAGVLGDYDAPEEGPECAARL